MVAAEHKANTEVTKYTLYLALTTSYGVSVVMTL